MRRVLITGANGQLGSELRELSFSYEDTFFFADKSTLDITDKDAVQSFVYENNIDAIVNCAAYTAVDRAESEPELADKINRLAVKNLAQIAKEKGATLVHISTDYVFDGKNYRPYIEDDDTNPNGVYGVSKLGGENEMCSVNPKNSVIIRTSWVYSSYGQNFVKTIVRLAKERDSLGVVYDQIGTPTYAADLARVILDILPRIKNESVEIYNYSNEGVLSWYDFAKEIVKMSKLGCAILPLESVEYPTPARRPHYSLLNKAKIKKDFDIEIPYWKDSLSKCLAKMGEKR